MKPQESAQVQSQDARLQGSNVYFAPLLPWHHKLWEQMSARAMSQDKPLAHAMLAAGMIGMGKRNFIWRFVAWLLCDQRGCHPVGACGNCESCHWLKSGTHPNLRVLPETNLPKDDYEAERASPKNDSPKKASPKPQPVIKVDDIRAIQPFIYQGGQGLKICVIDNAEQMTVAAANALLKTLEEPQSSVHFFLITDAKAKLLPTINSRLQQLPIGQIDPKVALDFVRQESGGVIHKAAASEDQIQQLLSIARGAPLSAVALAKAPWYGNRALWLTTWQALISKKRSVIAASDYWQGQLGIQEFIQLTELMVADIQSVLLGLPPLQQDIDFQSVLVQHQPNTIAIADLLACLHQLQTALQQNVQEKVAYDKLMAQLAAF